MKLQNCLASIILKQAKMIEIDNIRWIIAQSGDGKELVIECFVARASNDSAQQLDAIKRCKL